MSVEKSAAKLSDDAVYCAIFVRINSTSNTSYPSTSISNSHFPPPPQQPTVHLHNTTTMASKQDKGWERIFEYIGIDENRDADDDYFVAKNGDEYGIGYYHNTNFLCTRCWKLMKGGAYIQHKKGCLAASDEALHEAISGRKESATLWKGAMDMPEFQGEKNRCKVHFMQK